MKISKNTLLLTGAVALGVLCFVGARYYLVSYLTQQESNIAGKYKTRQVIVAKVAIPAGSALTSDNLAVRSIPERYLSSTTVEPNALDKIDGQRIMVDLQPGDPIDRGALERLEKVALSTTIAKGERAITVPVDQISSINGMLLPGDIIDIVYVGPGLTSNSYAGIQSAPTSDKKEAPKDLTHVRVMLQAVPVIATGKTTKRRMVKTENGTEHEVSVDFSTVTLKLSAQDAEQVMLAEKLGSLTAILRNPDDKDHIGKSIVDEVEFKSVEGPPAAGQHNYVQIIVGGSGVAGGLKQMAEVGGNMPASNNLAAAAPAADKAAPAQSAYDVKSRLGLTPPPAASANAANANQRTR